jgi:PKHD-type hydroxylase
MISKYLSNKNTLDQIPQPIDREKVNFSNGDQWYLDEKNYSDTYFIEDLFNDLEIDQIISIGEIIDKQRAKTEDAGENCLEQRRSFVSWMKINDYTKWIYQRCTNAVLRANEHFEYDLESFESLQFTRYDWEENGFYSSHVDSMSWSLPKNRKLSFVIQLSDPKTYEGGDLILWTSKDPRIINKKRGLITFFPSYTLHEVTPVTKGTRYTLVGWVHGPPFK